MALICPQCKFENKITDKYCQCCREVLERIIKRTPQGETLYPLVRKKRNILKLGVGAAAYQLEIQFDPSIQSYKVRCNQLGVITVNESESPPTLTDLTPLKWYSIFNGEILTFAQDQKIKLIFGISTGRAIPVEYSVKGSQRPEVRYKFIKMLGGTPYRKIYQYYDKRLNRDVVLTFLNPDIADIAEIRRFYRRHRTIPQIRHPNIPQLYDYGSWNKKNIQYYFTCREYVDGDSLENIQKGIERRSLKSLISIMLQIAEALRYIHERGLLHRNLDPSNIIIGRDGCPYLIGFRLIKDPSVNMEITMDGLKLARAGFASPELLRNKGVTEKTDLYSLAATFYWALTGFSPLGTEKLVEYYDKILQGERPRKLRWAVSNLNVADPIGIYDRALSKKRKGSQGWEEVPEELQELIDRCLRYRVEARPAIESVIESLHKMLERYDDEVIPRGDTKKFQVPVGIDCAGFDIAAFACPAPDGEGDFFDVFNLNENQFGILIGSTNSRGMPPVRIAAMAKMSIRLVAKLHHSTAESLRIVNRELLPQLPSNSYISAYYGILDRRNRTFRFSCAAHPPLLHYHPASKKKQLYEPRGPVMGLYQDDFFSCDEVILSLEPDDILFLCTVGLTEGENPDGDFFGTEVIWDKMQESKDDGKMTDLISAVHRAFVEFTRSKIPKKDITMLAIRALRE